MQDYPLRVQLNKMRALVNGAFSYSGKSAQNLCSAYRFELLKKLREHFILQGQTNVTIHLRLELVSNLIDYEGKALSTYTYYMYM